jgi:hypothetical protein
MVHQEEHQGQQRGGEQHDAAEVDFLDQDLQARGARRVLGDAHEHEDGGDQCQRQVDGEDRVPAEQAGEQTAQHWTDGRGRHARERQHPHGDAWRRDAEPITLRAEDAHGRRIGAGGPDAEQDAHGHEGAQRRRERAP